MPSCKKNKKCCTSDIQYHKVLNKNGFTLAEVLVTLGVIGVVAALTLPTLIANHQKKVTITRLKKSYTVLSQGLIQAQLVNGNYDTWPVGKDVVVDDYFNTYFKPFYNGTKICKNATDCGYKSIFPWKNLSDVQLGWGLCSNDTRILFTLNDGTIVFMPNNSPGSNGNTTYFNYLLFYIDVNGALSPNVLGRDVFLYQMDNKNTLRPYCYAQTNTYINEHCKKGGDINVNYNCCSAKIMADGWEIKDDYPW